MPHDFIDGPPEDLNNLQAWLGNQSYTMQFTKAEIRELVPTKGGKLHPFNKDTKPGGVNFERLMSQENASLCQSINEFWHSGSIRASKGVFFFRALFLEYHIALDILKNVLEEVYGIPRKAVAYESESLGRIIVDKSFKTADTDEEGDYF